MQRLNTFLIEKLKITTSSDSVNFSFRDLCNSIITFVKNNYPGELVHKTSTEYYINLNKLDIFKDNPLIVADDSKLSTILAAKNCIIGNILLNITNSDYITCFTINRNLTLKDPHATNISFDITERNFTDVFSVKDLNRLYIELSGENN